jgi:DNA-directed RNA polymerase subunit RPC12/RpoP
MLMSYHCSKCNSDMEEGFVLEKGDAGTLSSETWVAGKPDGSFFSGVSLRGKVVYDIVAFRCIACGYLESYAISKQ